MQPAIQLPCLPEDGLPECPAAGERSSERFVSPQFQCLDKGMLASDMGDSGFSACLERDAGIRRVVQKPRAKPVMWLHVHKAMGSMFYVQAGRNNESIVQPSFNGNWWPHDTRSGGHGGPSCEKRIKHFRDTGATWGQIEHAVTDDDLCHKDFNYGTFLRDPNELAVSKANFERFTPDQTIDALECLVQDKIEKSKACQESCQNIHGEHLWMFFDNFLVRTLGGDEVWKLEAGMVEEKHAQKAIERLSKFEAVVLKDDLINAASADHVAASFGWNNIMTKKPINPSKHLSSLNSAQAKMARHTNRFDYMVLEHFQKIPVKNRVRAFK